MNYEILATGSSGNCVIIEGAIAIDMGVSFKAIKPYMKDLQLVLLTHFHSDHFRSSTIKKLAAERPMLRFGCMEWLITPLIECGVSAKNIDVYEYDKCYGYDIKSGEFSMISPFPLFHDVSNCGYKIAIPNDEQGDCEYLLYATDTSKILTEAKGYDLYMIEANYEDEEVEQRIEKQILEGKDYIHEYKAMENHLSYQQAMDFICKNKGPNSEYVLLHGHKEGK